MHSSRKEKSTHLIVGTAMDVMASTTAVVHMEFLVITNGQVIKAIGCSFLLRNLNKGSRGALFPDRFLQYSYLNASLASLHCCRLFCFFFLLGWVDVDAMREDEERSHKRCLDLSSIVSLRQNGLLPGFASGCCRQ